MKKSWSDVKDKVIEAAKDASSPEHLASICSKLLDREISTEAVDRAFRRWRREDPSVLTMVDYVKSDEEVPLPKPSDLPPSLLELHKTKVKLKETKKQLREAIREAELAQERLDFVDAIRPEGELPRILPRETKSGIREATAVALASDWHVEETVEPETINDRNAYDLNVATERADRFFTGLDWMLNFSNQPKKMVVRDLVLWLGGDMITGYIHEELEESNQLSPIEATLFAQNLIANGIDRLLTSDTNLEQIIIPCNYGNHGRTGKKRRHKTGAKNSYEWLMYNTLANHYRDEPRVKFVIAGGSHLYLDIYDYTCRFHHGDDIRYYGGVGGLSIPLNKAIDAWNDFRHADMTFIGHYHQYQAFKHCLCNGSLIGYNAFALSVKARFEHPQQAFCLMDKSRGRSMTTPIWVGE